MIPGGRPLMWLAIGFALGWVWANRSDLSALWGHRQQLGGASKIASGLSDLGLTL